MKLGPTTSPTINQLFTRGVFNVNPITTDYHVQVANDLWDSNPQNSPSFDGAALAHVPFEVEAGFFGAIALEFGLGNELTNAAADSLDITLTNGSLTVWGIPEPTSVCIWGMLVIGLAGRRCCRQHGS